MVSAKVQAWCLWTVVVVVLVLAVLANTTDDGVRDTGRRGRTWGGTCVVVVG